MAENLQVGDEVLTRGLKEDRDNGQVGTIKKSVGKDRWAVQLQGQEKSKIMASKNLEKVEKFDPESMAYSIVGTWDDWDAHTMTWDASANRFEFSVVLGETGAESFKILLEDDWDFCVYPSVSDANPYEPHDINGPDDCETTGEWTIGSHADDKAGPQVLYKVYLYVAADGSPVKVTWEREGGPAPVEEEEASPVPEPVRPENESRPMAERRHVATAGDKDDRGYPSSGYGEPLPVVSRRRDADEMYGEALPVVSRRRDEDEMYELPVVSRRRDDDDRSGYGKTAGKGLFSIYQRNMEEERNMQRRKEQDKLEEQRVIEQERQARKRLERKLAAADEASMLQIQDQERQAEFQKEAQARRDLRQEDAKRAEVPAERGRCVECGQVCVRMTNGSCNKCHMQWQLITRKGWDANALCDGLAAGERAIQYHQAMHISKNEARLKVMQDYSQSFWRY